MIDYDDDDEVAEAMQNLSSDQNDSFLVSLIEETLPEFKFNDALSRNSILSLLAYTHKVRPCLLAGVPSSLTFTSENCNLHTYHFWASKIQTVELPTSSATSMTKTIILWMQRLGTSWCSLDLPSQ